MAGDWGTWHYGLVARWWAEFNQADPEELRLLETAIRRYGQPVLDLGCGTGRLLLPLLKRGFDVDGIDVSKDMADIAMSRVAESGGRTTRIRVQPMHELSTDRNYRTIFMWGVFGIGGSPDRDVQTLRRAWSVLEPGGALLMDHDARQVARPRDWPAAGERRRAANGDELELLTRQVGADKDRRQEALEIRVRLWRDEQLASEESGRLLETHYTIDETRAMLREAGFRRVTLKGRPHPGREAKDHEPLILIAVK
jgi:SAM-dependent methyltransferase